MNGHIDLEHGEYTMRVYAAEITNGNTITGQADVSMSLDTALQEGYLTQQDINQQTQTEKR